MPKLEQMIVIDKWSGRDVVQKCHKGRSKGDDHIIVDCAELSDYHDSRVIKQRSLLHEDVWNFDITTRNRLRGVVEVVDVVIFRRPGLSALSIAIRKSVHAKAL